MAIIVSMHHPQEGPGALGQVLQTHGHGLRFVQLHAGERLPGGLAGVDGVISMGGPMDVQDTAAHPWLTEELALLKAAHQAGKPIVGVCLGAQLIASALGGQVAPMAGGPEIGWHGLRLTFPGTTDPLLAGIPWSSVQFHLHGQEVTRLPPEAVPLAGSRQCRLQAFRVGARTYGFQYHFEWSQQDISLACRLPLLAQAGPAAVEQVRQGMAQHYETYRRLGDRLCQNIAGLLFPIDKR